MAQVGLASLAEPSKILLPPLHIKLDLMKNFVKSMDKTKKAFTYLQDKFSAISEAKLREGIFVGPQIRQLFQDNIFNNLLERKKKEPGTPLSW